MRRRDFITFLGGTGFAWPFATHAQKTSTPVIGFLYSTSPDPISNRLRAFREGLKEAGYIDGENVAIIYRFADGKKDLLADLAAELVRRRVAVIAAGNSISALAAKAAAATIPIVFAVPEDPVKQGLVASLARPGGNATGIYFLNTELVAKRLELLREVVPGAARVAVLVNPVNSTNVEPSLRDLESGAHLMGLEIQVLGARTSSEIEAAFETLARDRPDALFVANDGFFNSRRVQLAILAARHSMPASYGTREIAEVGGLMSYGANIPEAWRQAGAYVGHVLGGANPADLPVVQATKFELVINVVTAKALGLTVPPSLLARADEVIE